MLCRRALLWLVAFLAVGRLSADDLTGSGSIDWPGVGDWSLSFVSASQSGSVVSVVISTSSTAGGGWMEFNYQFKLEGSVVSSGFGVNNWADANNSAWVWNVNAPGSWDTLRLYPRQGGQVGEITVEVGPPVPDSYGVSVALPANLTKRKKLYFFLQAGVQVGWAMQEAGQSARTVYLGELESNTPVQAVEVVGGTIGLDSEGQWLLDPGTEYVPAGTQVEPSGESSPGSGATAEGSVDASNSVTVPLVDPTDAPEAPSPVSGPSAPSGSVVVGTISALATPNASPSGTEAASKADLEKQTNDLVAAVSSLNQQGGANADAVIGALDNLATANHEGQSAIVSAINAVASAANAGDVKVVEALNKSQVLAERSNELLSGVGTKLDATNEKLEVVKTNTAATATAIGNLNSALVERMGGTASDVTTAAETAISSAQTAGTAAGSAAAAALPSSPTGLGYTPSVSGGDASFLSLKMPAPFGGATVNFNPFANSGMASLAAWFRAATEWLALLLLGQFVFGQLRGSLDTLGTARQASGNPVVGGTGAQGTAAVNAGLITAAALVAITALVAWAFEGISVAGLVSNLTVSPLVGMSADVYWFLDQFIPLSTLITCAVARATWYLYSGPVVATYVTVCRFFIA